jgi:bifunctional enzyme CysN/CysC
MRNVLDLHAPILPTDWREIRGLTVPVDRNARAKIKSQRPACLWLTGLSGAGKSTVAELLEWTLHQKGHHTYILDGDLMRSGLCSDLGFSIDDRVEQTRRVSQTAGMMVDAGLIVIVAVISPFQEERERARRCFGPNEFIEIYVDTPLATCEMRDVKGLYRKARENIIPNFTGISSPYEPPEDPEVTLHCGTETPRESVAHVLNALRDFQIISDDTNQITPFSAR